MRRGLRFWLSGLGLPMALVLGAVILIPIDGHRYFGISVRSWALFGCAPLITLILAIVSIALRREPPSVDHRG